MLRIKIIFIIIFMINFNAFPLWAWSAYTHGAISIESLKDEPNFSNRISFYSSMPDISTNFFSPASKDKYYSLFHSENFFNVMKTLYHSKSLDRESQDNILGYLTHVISDEVAHGKNGYPDSKITFKVKTSMNHYTAYLFMDMLLYYNYFKNSSYGDLIPDLDLNLVGKAISLYNEKSGDSIEFSKKNFQKKLFLFRTSIGIEKAIFDTIIDDNPELFEEIREFYSDYRFGVNGRGGFEESVSHVKEELNNEEIKSFKLNISDFINKVDTGLYINGYLITSFISKHSDLIRYGKISSSLLNSAIEKLFSSKSEKSQTMGKFLSLLLFRNNLTFSEIISIIDGRTLNKSRDFRKYRDNMNQYSKDRNSWLSTFIPDYGFKDKERLVNSFITYEKNINELKFKRSNIDRISRKNILRLSHRRWNLYKKMRTTGYFHPIKKRKLKLNYKAISRLEEFYKNYIIEKNKAINNGNRKLVLKLNNYKKRFEKGIKKEIEEYQKLPWWKKIISIDKKIYIDSLSRELKICKKILKNRRNNIESSGNNKGMKYDLSIKTELTSPNSSGIDYIKPSSKTEAERLMQSAYKEYVSLFTDSRILDKNPQLVNEKLEKYNFYKKIVDEFNKNR